MKRALALAAALAVTLPACSGDDDETAPVTTAVMPTSSTTEIVASTTTTPTSATSATSTVVEPVDTTELVRSTEVGTSSDWCGVAEELYSLTTAFRQLDAGDTAAVQMSLIAILDRLTAITELVPAHLADDLDVSSQAFEMLDAALAEVGYDVAAADLSELDARAVEIGAANDRIRSYNAAECGIAVDVTGEGAP